MRRGTWLGAVLILAATGGQLVAQHLPEGAFVASVGYAVVDSGFDQYDNGGNTKPKLIATGFGPLYFGILQGTPLAATPGVTPNFSNVDLRTRGDVYALSGHYGATEDLTIGVIIRVADVVTQVRGQDTTDYAVVSNLVNRSGSVIHEPRLEDEILTIDFEGKHWYLDQYLEDDLRYKAAFVFGVTYRGAVNLRNNLVRFALVELARMNRPPYLSVGYEGQLSAGPDGSDWELGFGAKLQYHLEGDTNNASPNAIAVNVQTSFLAPGSPQLPVIDSVRAEDHLGAEAFVNVKTKVWEGLSLGTGLSWHYEAQTDFSRVLLTGNPVADSLVDDDRKTEERGYLHFIAEYDAIDEYLAGEWSVPWTLQFEIRDSIYGRNLSELSIVSMRVSVPLVAGRSSAG